MPKRSRRSIQPWAYTVMGGLQVTHATDESRLGAPIMGRGIPAPEALFELEAPRVSDRHSGPWWIPQDPSVTSEPTIVTVLRWAKWFTLVPVIPITLLQGDDDIELLAVRDVRAPARAERGSPQEKGQRRLREILSELATATEPNVEGSFKKAIRLFDQYGSAQGREIRLALLRFDYRPPPGGVATRRTHPAIIVPGDKARPD